MIYAQLCEDRERKYLTLDEDKPLIERQTVEEDAQNYNHIYRLQIEWNDIDQHRLDLDFLLFDLEKWSGGQR